MKFDPNKHHRRSIRLKNYDYTLAGAYFVTICVHRGRPRLGEVKDSMMHPNQLGEIILHAWNDLPNHYPHVMLDAFVIMPNHIHAILILLAPDETTNKRHGLSEIVRALKTFSAKRINKLLDTIGTPFWQRSYYEHIIRTPDSHASIREYIHNNPAKWQQDKLHPDAPPNKFNATW